MVSFLTRNRFQGSHLTRFDSTQQPLFQRISNARPRCRFQDNDRNFVVFEVLLVSKILIRRDQGIVSIPFGGFDESSVCELRPTFFRGGIHGYRMQKPAEWNRNSLGRKGFSHGDGLYEAGSGKFQHGFDLVPDHSGKPL